MAKLLATNGFIVHIIEWDRSGLKPRIEIKDGIVFKRLRLKASYGLRASYLIPVWVIFSFIQIIVGNYHIVQPQNLDCLIPTFFATKFTKRKKIIYDMADFYSDAYVVNIPIISLICSLLEKLLIRRVDAIILVSERQVLQIGATNLPKKVVLFYNTPDASFIKSNYHENLKKRENKSALSLFYAGILSYDRVKLLMNVINAIIGLPVKIIIAGFGEYKDLLRKLGEVNKQLVFLGYLDHEKVMEFTTRADIVLLPYDPSYINNKIGLPSKFFEAMACRTLVLAPKNTYMGEIAARERIGIVVDYNNQAEIRYAIESIIASKRDDLQLFTENAKKLYVERFNPQKINIKYLNLVKYFVSK